MLKKKERLTRVAFNHAFSTGSRTHTPYFQLVVANSTTFHGSVVVSKKVYKKAVDRNTQRRRLYAQLYLFHKAHASTKTFIVITKPAITGVSPVIVSEILSKALKSA